MRRNASYCDLSCVLFLYLRILIKSKGKEEENLIDVFDEIMIKNYFSFSKTFSSLQFYKKMIRIEFYSKNMATHTEYTDLGIISKGFRPDREIEKLYSQLELIDRRIERYRYRERHFSRYLSSIPSNSRELLSSRFNKGEEVEVPKDLFEQVIDEIYEIESAICLREGMDPCESERIEITEDEDTNLERMCDFFAL